MVSAYHAEPWNLTSSFAAAYYSACCPWDGPLVVTAHCACRTLASAFTEYILNLVDGSGGSAARRNVVLGQNGWPCRLVADKQDELQLVLDHLRSGNLNLRDYLMEMYERASMYFHQIGLAQCPPQRVQQIQMLHQQAQQARPCHIAHCHPAYLAGMKLFNSGWEVPWDISTPFLSHDARNPAESLPLCSISSFYCSITTI